MLSKLKSKKNKLVLILREEGIINLIKHFFVFLDFFVNRRLKKKIMNTFNYYPVKEKSMPYIVQIEPTSICNLKCNMCLRTMKEIKGNSLTFDQMKRIINQLKGTKEIILQGYGEPLLNKEIFKIIKYCKFKKIRTYLITNGMLLTKKNILNIIHSGLSWLKISFDGVTQETTSKLRNGINVDLFLSNMITLSRILKTKKPKINISFQVVVSKINIIEISEILNFLQKNQFTNVEVQSVLEWNSKIKQIDIDEKYLYLKKKINYMNKHQHMNIELTLQNSIGKRFKHSEICLEPWTTTFIDANGNVIACPLGCFSNTLLMGNVFDKPFKQIWNNKPYVRLRHELKSGKFRPICKKFCY